MTTVTLPKANNVGLVDAIREGWYNKDTGELVPGVKVSPGDTVVDVGCGDGGHISFCARQGAAVILVDLDADRLEKTEERVRAQASNSCRAIVSDCDPLPIDTGTTDLTICTEVLEHVPDPAQFLSELKRVTKPGGRLLLTVPDSRSESLISTTAPAEYFQEPNHIRVFDAESFGKLVSDSGLRIIDHRFQGCYTTFRLLFSWLSQPEGSPVAPTGTTNIMVQHWAALWKEMMQLPGNEK